MGLKPVVITLVISLSFLLFMTLLWLKEKRHLKDKDSENIKLHEEQASKYKNYLHEIAEL
jgi:hypothetical protein